METKKARNSLRVLFRTIVGTLNLKEVKERHHIVSKQVEMFTSEGRKKCGLIYFDVKYRSREE